MESSYLSLESELSLQEPAGNIEHALGNIIFHPCKSSAASKDQTALGESALSLEPIFDHGDPSKEAFQATTPCSMIDSPFSLKTNERNGMSVPNTEESSSSMDQDLKDLEMARPSCVPYDGRDFLLPPAQHPIYELQPMRDAIDIDIVDYMISDPLSRSYGHKLPPMMDIENDGKEHFRYVPRFGVYLGRIVNPNFSQLYGSRQTVCYEVKGTTRWIRDNLDRMLLLDREVPYEVDTAGSRGEWEPHGKSEYSLDIGK